MVYRTSIVYFFSLNSLRKRVKHEWRQLKVLEISSINFYQFLDERTGSIGGMQTCRVDCQRDKWTPQVSITAHKANGIKQMSQTRTPGHSKSCFGEATILTARRKYTYTWAADLNSHPPHHTASHRITQKFYLYIGKPTPST